MAFAQVSVAMDAGQILSRAAIASIKLAPGIVVDSVTLAISQIIWLALETTICKIILQV